MNKQQLVFIEGALNHIKIFQVSRPGSLVAKHYNLYVLKCLDDEGEVKIFIKSKQVLKLTGDEFSFEKITLRSQGQCVYYKGKFLGNY